MTLEGKWSSASFSPSTSVLLSVFTSTKPPSRTLRGPGSQHLGLVLQQKKGRFLFAMFTLPLSRTAKPYFVNAELASMPLPPHIPSLTCFMTFALNSFDTASARSSRRKELETYGPTLFLASFKTDFAYGS